MKKYHQQKTKGFTLIEILLVLVIVGVLLYMAVGYFQQKSIQARVEKTSLQMQQVLNAGLAYYVTNGFWPDGGGDDSIECLQSKGGDDKCKIPYLIDPFKNPWGNQYKINSSDKSGLFYTYTKVEAGNMSAAIATMIAGKLPMAYTSDDDSSPPKEDNACNNNDDECYVVAAVNIPGQNLNNASAVNFAGVYHHGACVPVPTCPVDAKGKTMIPTILVSPVSVSGLSDTNNQSTYPISSFTAYATTDNGDLNDTPLSCTNLNAGSPSPTECDLSGGVKSPNNKYWRVCLQVMTERGDITSTNTSPDWGKYVSLLAITRCSIADEPSGSGFNVFSN